MIDDAIKRLEEISNRADQPQAEEEEEEDEEGRDPNTRAGRSCKMSISDRAKPRPVKIFKSRIGLGLRNFAKSRTNLDRLLLGPGGPWIPG